jgi:hypothetical protein
MTAGLPNGDMALLEIGKLRDYCLNAEHPRGKHKARLFRAALGFGREDAEELRGYLLAAAIAETATALHIDPWGQYWRIDAPVTRQERRALVRTLWIVRTSEAAPRFVTCWVL